MRQEREYFGNLYRNKGNLGIDPYTLRTGIPRQFNIYNEENNGYYKYDWGSKPIHNGGNPPNLWQTMTKSEWEYLLGHNCWSEGTVDNKFGIIIIPSDFIDPHKNNSTVAGKNFASGPKSYNNYTSADWEYMQSNGAVFLPDAGSISVSTNSAATNHYYSSNFRYWTSTYSKNTFSYCACVTTEDDGIFLSDNRQSYYCGQSVRLVRDAEFIKEDLNYVDEYGIDRGSGITVYGITWAPVNCGYIAPGESDSTGKKYDKGYKYGKYYQGGRIYGQGYDSNDEDVYSNISTSYTSANGTENNKNTYGYNWWHYLYGTIPLNHLHKNMYRTWWNAGDESDPTKGPFDPCPKGWRIPTEAELTLLVESKNTAEVTDTTINGQTYNGRRFKDGKTTLFLMNGGYIKNSGAQRGTAGYYYCSKPYFSNTYQLNYYTSLLTGFDTGTSKSNQLLLKSLYTAYAQSIRCVKE